MPAFCGRSTSDFVSKFCLRFPVSFIVFMSDLYHAELNCCSLRSSAPYLSSGVLRMVTMLQRSFLHAPVVLNMKFFNEQFGVWPQSALVFIEPLTTLETYNQWETVGSVIAVFEILKAESK